MLHYGGSRRREEREEVEAVAHNAIKRLEKKHGANCGESYAARLARVRRS